MRKTTNKTKNMIDMKRIWHRDKDRRKVQIEEKNAIVEGRKY